MKKFVYKVMGQLRNLCQKAWEAAKRAGGAFLGVFVDYNNGSIWYRTEREDFRLVGWRIVKKWIHSLDKSGRMVKHPSWSLVQG